MLLAPVFLRSAETPCYDCKESISVFCLAARAVVDEELVDGKVERETFDSDEGLVRVSDLESIDARIERALTHQAPTYRKAFSRTQGARVFMNHCPHCAARQGDFFLHSEPDGPFFAHEDLNPGITDCLLFETGEFTFEGSFHL